MDKRTVWMTNQQALAYVDMLCCVLAANSQLSQTIATADSFSHSGLQLLQNTINYNCSFCDAHQWNVN